MRTNPRPWISSILVAGAVMVGGGAAAEPVAKPVTPPERSQHPRTGLLADLSFASGSDQLRWGAGRKLGRIAGWAKKYPYGAIVVEGHADHVGSDEANVELSLRRAYTVARELIEAGVPANQIVVAGFGENAPTKRGTNRRVAVWATRSGRDVALATVTARRPAVVHGAAEITVRTARR